MGPVCPRNECGNRSFRPPSVPFGRYYRTSDRHWVPRFRCLGCRRTFSSATAHPCFGQNKRHLNEAIRFLLVSGMSMRRIARFFPVHRTTVDRKLKFLGLRGRAGLQEFRETRKDLPVVQFDELETLEHTKYKPLSVVVAVIPKERKILGFEVAGMPAKGPLAEKARKKYGVRRDGRGQALDTLLTSLRPCMGPDPILVSDSNPRYPPHIRRCCPEARHLAKAGGRGCVTGQGELKAGRFDPLFDLNHTFAMLRDNIRRLVRRTWCTTKKMERLADHLAIYADFHNRVLT